MKKLVDHLNQRYPSWLDWEPETMRLALSRHIHREEDFNALMALQTALNTQRDEEGFHFDNWRIFEKMVVALNGHVPDFGEIEKATPEEIAFAVRLFESIHPVSFGEEVAKYIAASFRNAEIVYCPFWPDVDQYIEKIPLREQVAEAWQDRHRADLDEEDVVPIQVARLVAIEEILKGRGAP